MHSSRVRAKLPGEQKSFRTVKTKTGSKVLQRIFVILHDCIKWQWYQIFDKYKVKYCNESGVEKEGILPFCSGGCYLSIPAEEVIEDSSFIVSGSRLKRANMKKEKRSKKDS